MQRLQAEVRSKNVGEQAEIKKWLIRQYDELDGQSSPYLKLEH